MSETARHAHALAPPPPPPLPQYSFWDSITNVSGRLKTEVSDRSLRGPKIRDFLRDLAKEAERDAFYARDHALQQVREELRALPGDAGAPAFDVVTPVMTGDAAAGTHARRPTPLAGAVTALGGRLPPPVAAFSPLPPGTPVPPASPAAEAAAVGGTLAASAIVAAPTAAPAVAAALPATAPAAAAAPPTILVAAAAAAGPSPSDSPPSEQQVVQQLPAIIDTIYPPTHAHLRVVSVEMDSGRAMQSAAKCPFLLTFNVRGP